MRIRNLALSGTLGLLAFAATAAAPASDVAQCAATLNPASVPIQEAPLELQYTLSTPIGTVAQATPQPLSGLEVTAHQAQDRRLSVNTSAAATGEWEITFHGENEAVCTGILTVVPGL